MVRPTRTALATALLGAGLVALGAAPAAAAPGPGKDFSEHVRACNEHFSGEMNPGVHHRGFAGWDADHEC